MKILAFDTSARVASAAVCCGEEIISEASVNARLTHSETLMPLCDAVLKNAKLSLKEIDLFAVAAGPGSFTGLRIGIAAVKGLAHALEKPCVPVSTLEALGENLRGLEGVACAVMDARCGQVYNALFALENGAVNRLCDDRAISIDALSHAVENFKKPVFLVGDGAYLCYNEMTSQKQPEEAFAGPEGETGRLLLAPPLLRLQRAASVAFCAGRMAQAGKTVSAAALNPAYLRLPQAERMLRKKQEAGEAPA